MLRQSASIKSRQLAASQQGTLNPGPATPRPVNKKRRTGSPNNNNSIVTQSTNKKKRAKLSSKDYENLTTATLPVVSVKSADPCVTFLIEI
ncbi:hypothetical protein BGW39_009590 [Mortierella sp. 14UC]|nr:hypothetical protein BGW39_009590 [Mortierella sp. 14UC]